MRSTRGRTTSVRRRLGLATAAALVCSLEAVVGPSAFGTAPAGASSSYPVQATYTPTGPCATVATSFSANGETYDVFRPADYSALGFRSPIVTWGDGTGALPTTYTDLLDHFASYGFTVIGVALKTTGSGREIVGAAQELVNLDGTAGSVFYGHLDTSEVAAAGHSQGATGATNAATADPSLITTLMTFSLPAAHWSRANADCATATTCVPHPTQLTRPVFFIGTHGWLDNTLTVCLLTWAACWYPKGIAPVSAERAYFDGVDGPAALGVIEDSGGNRADHNTVQDSGAPTGFYGYATAWLEYQLRGTWWAALAFAGPMPEILVNANWPTSQVK